MSEDAPLAAAELEATVLRLGDRCAQLERLLDRARLVVDTARTTDGIPSALHIQLLALHQSVKRLDEA